MADKAVTLICTAADKVAAEALASTFPGGSGTFSVKLTTAAPPVGDVSEPEAATHWAGSGFVDGDMADAFDVSLSPMFKVFPLADGQTFWDHLAACTPPLRMCQEPI